MDARSRVITVSASTDDTKAMGAISRMFAELAGEPAVFVGFAAATEELPPSPGLTQQALEAAKEVDAAAGMPAAPPAPAEEEGEEVPPANVDTAKVFAGAAQVPPAPPAPATPPVPPAAATPPPPVELDKNGLPWDARINTSNKAKTGPGVWKRVPRIADSYYEEVLAELKANMAAPAPSVPPAPPAGDTTPPVPPAPPAPAASDTAPPAPPVPPAAAEAEPTTYAQLLGVVAKHIQSNTITHDEVNSVCVLSGLSDLNAVSQRPDFVPTIFAGCKAIWDTRA